MKLRKYDWYDEKNHCAMYGIQGQLEKGKPFINICEYKNPCIYSNENERDIKMKVLQIQFRVLKEANKNIEKAGSKIAKCD